MKFFPPSLDLIRVQILGPDAIWMWSWTEPSELGYVLGGVGQRVLDSRQSTCEVFRRIPSRPT